MSAEASEERMSPETAGPRGEWSAPREGMGLALSGGGYRAALFGLGSLWRLNELGLLPRLKRITSVSGGSLTAGVVAARWSELTFDGTGCATNFHSVVVQRLRLFCSCTLDWKAILAGLIPFVSAAGVTRRVYEQHLVRTPAGKVATLGDLPAAEAGPDFVFYATGLQTGSSFRFSRDGLYDWKLGRLPAPQVSLGTALAASAAFPPLLSPIRLKTDATHWLDAPERPRLREADRIRHKLRLGDGGIYDNMGIEALWKHLDCVLVSDAGAPFEFVARPWTNWISQLGRVRNILIDQTRALRKRMLMGDLERGRYTGAYWGISTRIWDYPGIQPMCSDSAETAALAHVGTRLKALEAASQERLINWGYALADAAWRSRVQSGASMGGWPYPARAFPGPPSGDSGGIRPA